MVGSTEQLHSQWIADLEGILTFRLGEWWLVVEVQAAAVLVLEGLEALGFTVAVCGDWSTWEGGAAHRSDAGLDEHGDKLGAEADPVDVIPA